MHTANAKTGGNAWSNYGWTCFKDIFLLWRRLNLFMAFVTTESFPCRTKYGENTILFIHPLWLTKCEDSFSGTHFNRHMSTLWEPHELSFFQICRQISAFAWWRWGKMESVWNCVCNVTLIERGDAMNVKSQRFNSDNTTLWPLQILCKMNLEWYRITWLKRFTGSLTLTISLWIRLTLRHWITRTHTNNPNQCIWSWSSTLHQPKMKTEKNVHRVVTLKQFNHKRFQSI